VAPDEVALGIAGALCGAPFADLPITNAAVADAVSMFYGATGASGRARGVNLLALAFGSVGFIAHRAAEVKGLPQPAMDVIQCLIQWWGALAADAFYWGPTPEEATALFVRLTGAWTELVFAWHRFAKTPRVTFATVFGNAPLHPPTSDMEALEVTTAPLRRNEDVVSLEAALGRLSTGEYSVFWRSGEPAIDIFGRSAPVASTQCHTLTTDVGSRFDGYARCIGGVAERVSAALRASNAQDRAVHLFVTPLPFAPSPKQLEAIQLPAGHFVAAVSTERSSCDSVLWTYARGSEFVNITTAKAAVSENASTPV